MLAGLSGAGGGHRKKLEEAARLWARGDFTEEDDEVANRSAIDEDLAAFGMVAEGDIVVARAETFHLWPENVEAWNLFVACQTQWRTTGMEGRRVGLDVHGVERAMWRMRVRPKHRRRRWDEIAVMEFAALDEWAKRAERQAAKSRRT